MDTIKTVIIAVLIALVVRTVAYEPFKIPSGSMKPTLLVGDYLFVSKYSYGYSKYSILGDPNLFSGRILGREPKRGDVVVFRPEPNPSRAFIKRLVGLPGDRVQVQAGRLHLNGQPLDRQIVRDEKQPEFDEYGNMISRGTTFRLYNETMPLKAEGKGPREYSIQEESDSDMFDQTRELTVPEGHYFMMGDNRDNSADSRTHVVKFVPFENLVGRAEIIFFSIERGAAWWQFWTWPSRIRFGRLLDRIR